MAPDSANVFIRQLTGVRFVAAAWVVLYHYQGPLAAAGREVEHVCLMIYDVTEAAEAQLRQAP